MAKEEIPPKSAALDSPRQAGPTRLGSTTRFQGELESHEDTVIEGTFQGKIIVPSGRLTVSREARVKAEVQVRSLLLHGELIGPVSASERVQISETGRMSGDITTPKLMVANGAQFKGGINIPRN